MEQLKKIGKVEPKKSTDIKTSRIGIGFEKLDRDLFDPEKAYPFFENLGVKKVRLQSGWQRTEKEKGVYDFAWLDSIVDKMIELGIEPWLCLCYGNKLYTEEAKKHFGAVGCPPIKTEEERNAWDAYVTETVKHFKGRISLYEVWNEPDGQWCWKHGPNAKEYADFTIATSKACKKADPDCMVAGLALCWRSDFAEDFFKTDALNYLDAITYHSYDSRDQVWVKRYTAIKDLLLSSGNEDIKIIQGEAGTQSRSDGCGALAKGGWTEAIQAKYLLRHLITDIALDVDFTSYFSTMDMAEALNGTEGELATIKDFGYFGVVGAEFDDNARATGNYYAKPSYYALQTLCSVLAEEYEIFDAETRNVKTYSERMMADAYNFDNVQHYTFRRNDGATALFYWKKADILTETYNGETSFELKVDNLNGKVMLTDLLDGTVYDCEGHYEVENGTYIFKNVPLTDSPLLITIGDFIK